MYGKSEKRLVYLLQKDITLIILYKYLIQNV